MAKVFFVRYLKIALNVMILAGIFAVVMPDVASASAPPGALAPSPIVPPAAPVAITMTGSGTFSKIAFNMTNSIQFLPGLLTGASYLFAMLLGVKGVLRIKDHVENPRQTPLKDATVLLMAGGALFALPIVYEAMFNTVGSTTYLVSAAPVSKIQFNVN